MANDAAKQQHQMIGVNDDSGKKLYRYNEHPDAQWFKNDANLGLFIHYGISTVNSCVDLSWGMIANKPWENKIGCEYRITPNKYWALAEEFNPVHFEEEINKLLERVKKLGFTYAVFTTKHHDGFALWGSKFGDFNIGKYHKGLDLVKIFTDACRKHDLNVGLYYSPPDWRWFKDYHTFSFGSDGSSEKPHYDADHNPVELKKPDKKTMDGYYEYARGQVQELLTNYGKIDVLWFDGTCNEPNRVITLEEIRKLQPSIVVNDRMHCDGDFTTSEVGMPEEKPENTWEHCDILTDSPWWAYMHQVRKYHSGEWMFNRYLKCKEWGGNFLINIGPKADGSIPKEAYECLDDFEKISGKL